MVKYFLKEFCLIFIYFDYLGPNNEGCNDENNMNVTMSNSTVTFTNEPDFISTIGNENITLTTEKTVVSSEHSPENVTVAVNEYNSTQSDMDIATTSVVEDTMITASISEDTTTEEVLEGSTTEEVLEGSTTEEVLEGSTTEEVLESTTTEEVLESSTTEFVETTTQIVSTTVLSNLCVDSEFECCPDGKTPAEVIEFLL
jgi:hypothetical protein